MSLRSPSPSHAPANLWSSFSRTGDLTFAGFVIDRNRPTKTFIVEFLLDGEIAGIVQANEYRNQIRKAGLGDGRFGFSVKLAADQVQTSTMIEARVANTDAIIGDPISLRSPIQKAEGADGDQRSHVEWCFGLRLSGWLAPHSDASPAQKIAAFFGNDIVAETTPHRWKHVKTANDGEIPARAFDLYLPRRFADGRVHRIKILADGKELQGSPVTLIAFDDGLSQFLDRAPAAAAHDWMRACFFDSVMPMSMPFVEYQKWGEKYEFADLNVEDLPDLKVIVVGDNNDQTIKSLENQTHQGWTAASIDGTAQQLAFARGQALEFLRGSGNENGFVLLLPAGAILADTALARIATAVRDNPQASAIYGDLEFLDQDQRRWPLFFPAFDRERLLEQGYCAYMFAAREDEVSRSIKDGADDFMQVFFAMLGDRVTDSRIVHIPGALATLGELDTKATADRLARAAKSHLGIRGFVANGTPTDGSLLPAVHIRRTGLPTPPSVSIVIPTRNRVDLLRPCLASIERGATNHIAEIIVVDNDSTDPETLDFLSDCERSQRVRVMRVPGYFNYSRLNNIAVKQARGSNICLLNNDIEVITRDWLEEMLGRLIEPDVGAVGALLMWGSGVVQHGGVVLGTLFAADHAFVDRLAEDPGYSDLLRVAHQCSAVTAACLLTRKEDYEAVGGLDEIFFPVNFNDVDYCLRQRARQKRIVFTPHARLFHHESASRGPDNRPDRAGRARRELAALRARWQDTLLSDPFYSPALALDPIPYSGLAWPPRAFHPRQAVPPVPVEIPPGF